MKTRILPNYQSLHLLVLRKYFSPHTGNFTIPYRKVLKLLYPLPMQIYPTSLHSIANLLKNVERLQTSLLLFFHFTPLRVAQGCYNKAKGHSITVPTGCPQGTRQRCAPLPGSIGPNMADQTTTHDYKLRRAVSVLPARAYLLPLPLFMHRYSCWA